MPPPFWNCRVFLLPAILLLAGVAALSVDMPIARAVKTWNVSPSIHEDLAFFDYFEGFGHAIGVIVLLLGLYQLDHSRRRAIPRLLACTLAAGGFADVLKLIILRNRPYFQDLTQTVWSTFGPWFGTWVRGSEAHSLPSAHTATAVAFAAALIWLYPQGRLLFTALAVLVGCQRIASEMHYLSDVLVGAAVGAFMAQCFLNFGLLPVWFDRWEERRREASGGDCPLQSAGDDVG